MTKSIKNLLLEPLRIIKSGATVKHLQIVKVKIKIHPPKEAYQRTQTELLTN
jgi:hypothetical protein